MNIRYQIFVSSTYLDLIDERSHVIAELNKVGYIAIGMEQFPASDEEQMDFIRPIIDESDYYVVILKGKYGTPANDGISYTQKEFEYAVRQGKPAIAFIYKHYDKLTVEQTEKAPELMLKFHDFKKSILDKKIVRFWENQDELASAVKDSLTDLVRRKPSFGWIRGDNAIDPKIFAQLEELRNRNADLVEEIAKLTSNPLLPSDLSHGADKVLIGYTVLDKQDANGQKALLREESLSSTWDLMLNFLRESIYRESEEDVLVDVITNYLRKDSNLNEGQSIKIEPGAMKKLRFQYEALGLIETFTRIIEPSITGRTIVSSAMMRNITKRTAICWRFSERGKKYVSRINAIPRDLAKGNPP